MPKVFENKRLRRDEVTEGGEGCITLYSSSSVIRVITSRKMKLAAHLARMGETTRKTKTEVGE
jgi:hypothetical protein